MPQLQYSKVNNAIITLGDTDDSGKGKHFKSRFIQPGLVGYPGQFGNALIKKENLDKFVYTLRAKPVIINHKDKIQDKDKVGIVNNVWFNPDDGWYWCDGIIYDDEAINLINNGWSVSCAYDFTKADNSGGTENNIPYDIEFLDGEFNHLALVDNPRYEGANIVFNSKAVVINDAEFENKHPRDEIGRFTDTNSNQKKLGESLYLINKKAKAYRDAINFVNGMGLPSTQVDEVLADELGLKVTDGKVKIGNEEIRADFDTFDWYTEKDFDNENDKELWKNIKSKLYKMRIKWGNPLTDKMNELYSYKDKLIKKLDLKPVDKHKFKQGGSYVIKDMYKLGDFEFHGKDDTYWNYTEEERTKIPLLDAINSEIKIDSKMSIEDALKEVKKYLGDIVSNSKVENGFITINGGTEEEKVIWVPFNVISENAKKRIVEIANSYKEGDETKFDFAHTRVKPSEEQINYIKNTLKEIRDKYNFKGVAQIEISSELNKGSLGVCYSPDNCSVVSLSPQLYTGKYDQQKWDKSVEEGFHPKGTGEMVKSVLVHELGHAITCNSKNEKFWGEIEKIRKDYLKEVKKGDNKHPDFISGYARTNKYEFVAEAFCQGSLSKNYGKYTKDVMETIQKHFAKNYQTKLFNAKEEKNDNEDFWMEEYGFGYPIDEKSFEEFREKINKEQKEENKTQNSLTDTILNAIAELIVGE